MMKLILTFQINIKMEKFARKCSVTGEGMNEGYVFSDGYFYAKDEQTAKVIALREYDKELSDMFTDDDDDDWEVYWTEWEDEDDYQYEMVNGVLTEIEVPAVNKKTCSIYLQGIRHNTFN